MNYIKTTLSNHLLYQLLIASVSYFFVSQVDCNFCCIIVSPTSGQIRRNWFCPSRLRTIVAVDLWKPYDKLESGKNLLMYDFY
jgi:hypothetical protein